MWRGGLGRDTVDKCVVCCVGVERSSSEGKTSDKQAKPGRGEESAQGSGKFRPNFRETKGVKLKGSLSVHPESCRVARAKREIGERR